MVLCFYKTQRATIYPEVLYWKILHTRIYLRKITSRICNNFQGALGLRPTGKKVYYETKRTNMLIETTVTTYFITINLCQLTQVRQTKSQNIGTNQRIPV